MENDPLAQWHRVQEGVYFFNYANQRGAKSDRSPQSTLLAPRHLKVFEIYTDDIFNIGETAIKG
jgi:hypothetical protein